MRGFEADHKILTENEGWDSEAKGIPLDVAVPPECNTQNQVPNGSADHVDITDVGCIRDRLVKEDNKHRVDVLRAEKLGCVQSCCHDVGENDSPIFE